MPRGRRSARARAGRFASSVTRRTRSPSRLCHGQRCFNPRPAAVTRRTGRTLASAGESPSFNPRPAAVTRRTDVLSALPSYRLVSIRAPQQSRGEPKLAHELSFVLEFQSAPRSSHEANSRYAPTKCRRASFNPRPAAVTRRTDAAAGMFASSKFQSAPRSSHEANRRASLQRATWRGFNPRPAAVTRRTSGFLRLGMTTP